MMRSIFAAALETLESRQLLSASPTSTLVPIVGASSGLTASANGAVVTGSKVRVNGNDAENAATGVDRDTAITFNVDTPVGGGGVDGSTLSGGSNGSVQLFDVTNGAPGSIVSGYRVITSGGGDTIQIILGANLLAANHDFRVLINSGTSTVKTLSGDDYDPFIYNFRTGTFFEQSFVGQIEFDSNTLIDNPAGSNSSFSSVTIGPDGRLYAGTLQGYIYRYDINAATGALSNPVQWSIIRNNNAGAARFITGLTFDPRATADNPVLWVSHGQAKYGETVPGNAAVSGFAQDYTGKITRIKGTAANPLSVYEDVIVGVPRSAKDHLNNQIAFDPGTNSKNLYFLIPSKSAMGRADSTWGNRSEDLYSAALFRLQLKSKNDRMGIEEYLADKGPINLDPNATVKYNVLKGTNPLRFYATGIRNAYDIVIHSNGHMYLPTNGSASGGNTPGTPTAGTEPQRVYGTFNGATVPARTDVRQDIEDYLYDVKEGGYYGQPNPNRAEYVLNGGNPTTGQDAFEVDGTNGYPVGVQPDSNYRGAAYSFGLHVSPDGAIEYKSDAFGGALKGSLIVARYAGGSDLTVLKPNAAGSFSSQSESLGVTGFKNLDSPLDLVEDQRNGNLYVVSLPNRTNGSGKITLLHPKSGTLTTTDGATKYGFHAVPGDTDGVTKTITIKNTGNLQAVIDPKLIRFTGRDRRGSGFEITNLTSIVGNGDLIMIPRNGTVSFQVKFVSRAGSTTDNYKAINMLVPTGKVPTDQQYLLLQLRGFNDGGASASSVHTASLKTAAFKAAPLSAQATTTKTVAKANIPQKSLYFNAVRGEQNKQILRITNDGDRNLTLKPDSVKILGGDRASFSVDFPAIGVAIKPGRRLDLEVTFKPDDGATFDVKVARLSIVTNDPLNPAFAIVLRGLPTAGTDGGSHEPSLQQVFNTYGLPINDGDTSPLEYQLGTPSSDSDEVTVQTLVKADPSKAVTIRPLAVFGTDNGPAVRVGTYTPGKPSSDELLWYVPRESAQSVSPIVYGQTVIDPGTAPFGLVGEFPGFSNPDGGDRLVYSEDQLNNVWEKNSSNLRKVRFYPYIDSFGNPVANAYVVAMEEFTAAYDNQDVVFIVTNVKPFTPTKPVMSVVNALGAPNPDYAVFNKVQTPDSDVPNATHTQNTFIVSNTGSADLTVNVAATGQYSVSAGGTSFTVPPGTSHNVTVKFNATTGASTTGSLYTGKLTFTSNDSALPSKVFELRGWWQQYSEFLPSNHGKSLEPTARQIVEDIFGFKTVLNNSGQNLNTNGTVRATGDEVISPYWQAADENAAVRVVQLASFHNQTFTNETTGKVSATQSFLSWFDEGKKTSVHGVGALKHKAGDGQTFLPRGNNGGITAGYFVPQDKTFGFVVEGKEFSDPAFNRTSSQASNYGHFVRFFPAKGADGVVIPNTYLLIHDYNREFTNFDFNDNIYLISNIVPKGAVKSPLTVFTEDTSKGARIAFTSPATGARIAGFNVYRSSSATSGFTKITDTPLARRPVTVFLDESVTADQTFYYRIASVGNDGKESVPVTVQI